jgi:hypothetical protein
MQFRVGIYHAFVVLGAHDRFEDENGPNQSEAMMQGLVEGKTGS